MTASVTSIKKNKTAASAANAAQVGRRVSLGTAWETPNDNFFAGTLQGASAEYKNQDELLGLIGAPAEGHQWRIKLFVRELKNGKTVVDAVLQEEPMFQR